MKNKKILIFGTGAVGGYFGSMIHKAGYDITFVARGKNYEILEQKGLTLIQDKEKEILKVKVLEPIHELALQGYFDYILVCTKSKDTKEAALKIKPNVGTDTCVVSLQNGVENEDIIGSVIGIDKVAGGLTFVASRLLEPGVIYQFGYNGSMLGELDGRVSERILNLQKIFLKSGIDCKVSENMRAELWNKLVWNTSFNSLSVFTGKTVDKLLEEDYELLKSIMIEVREVALALGLNIRKDTVEFNLERSKGFTGFKTSMLQDFEAGKSIELEELVGVVIKKAKEKNVPVPNIEEVYNEIKLKQKSEKQKSLS